MKPFEKGGIPLFVAGSLGCSVGNRMHVPVGIPTTCTCTVVHVPLPRQVKQSKLPALASSRRPAALQTSPRHSSATFLRPHPPCTTCFAPLHACSSSALELRRAYLSSDAPEHLLKLRLLLYANLHKITTRGKAPSIRRHRLVYLLLPVPYRPCRNVSAQRGSDLQPATPPRPTAPNEPPASARR